MSYVSETITENDGHLVLTKNGYEPFFGVNRIEKDRYVKLRFTDGSILECSEDHPLMTIEGMVRAKELDKKTEILTKGGGCFLESKRVIKRKTYLYDLINAGADNVYYTNGVLSHNREFLGSINTLIDPKKLSSLAYKKPVKRVRDLDIYEDPQKNHVYVTVADTSRGSGIDFSAFIVFDVTEIPYRVVAKYRSDVVPILQYPNHIYEVSKAYNEALVLVEVNDAGQEVADILHYELEYEHVMVTYSNSRRGSQVGTSVQKSRLGVMTNKQIKRIGCVNLKTLVENDKLLFTDYDLYFELHRFIAVKASYEAEEGYHDDLVMCCVLFSWLVQQPYFKEQTATDARASIYHDNKQMIEEDVQNFGFSTFDSDHVVDDSPRVVDPFYDLDIGPHRDTWDDDGAFLIF